MHSDFSLNTTGYEFRSTKYTRYGLRFLDYSEMVIEFRCIIHVCTYGHTYSESMDQPGKVANPARGQLNRENEYSPVRVRMD